MNFLLALLLLLALIVVCVAIAAFFMRPKSGPTRRERQLETELDAVRELAYQYRDVDQGLAEAIIDRIADFNRKEIS